MRRVLFATFGSYGDLFPYLAIGRELRRRGHRVTVATSASLRARVETSGLEFHPVRPDVSLDDAELLEYVFDARRGTERVVRMVASVVRETYEDTLAAAHLADCLVTHPITFGAVLVARKLRMPWVSTVLAPTSLLSAWDPPVLAPAPWLTRQWPFGRTLLKAVFALGRRSAIPWVRPVLRLEKEIGLRPGGNPVFGASHSPGMVLALFSSLFGSPQPDWPPNTLQTGFPFYDDPALQRLDPALETFLTEGRPVVFTLGSSAVGAAGNLYRESLRAVERLGLRAVFLTGPHGHELPATMPRGTLRWPYAPHSLLFPRAAAIVHQGGVGTTAQAMRAGKPALVVPFSHDQFDNGERVKRLGAGEVLYRSRYTAGRAEEQIRRLLSEPAFTEAASRVAEALAIENGAVRAADAIESSLQPSEQAMGNQD